MANATRIAAPATILYLHSSSGLYGADVQLALIVRGLDPGRHRALAVLPAEADVGGDLEPVLREAGAEVVRRELAVLRRRRLTPGGLARLAAAVHRDRSELAALARERGAALVHANTSVLPGALPAARAAGLPLVQHVREIYAGFGPLWPPYRRRLERADALVCVSEATAARLGGAEVVRDGLWRVPEPADRRAARRALGIEADRFAVALLGRISGWKGQDLLARALAEPPLREIGALGIVAGEPFPGEERHRERLARLAEALGVADRLRLVGFRADVESVLGAADAVCVPSTRPDPLPNSALEAAAGGRCVVGAAHGGLPEIVRDGQTGLLFEPGDAAALAAALARLAADPALAARLGAAAAADVRERFAPERLAAALAAIYDRLLGGSPAATR